MGGRNRTGGAAAPRGSIRAMEELVLHRRRPLRAGLSSALLACFGVLLIAAGVLQVLGGGPEALLASFPFGMGGLLLWTVLLDLRAHRLPHVYALTPDGVRLSRGTLTFLLPSSALREFTLTEPPMPRARLLRPRTVPCLLAVRIDPAASAALPDYVRPLAEAAPGELRLPAVGGDGKVPVDDVRDFVRRHALADWPDPSPRR